MPPGPSLGEEPSEGSLELIPGESLVGGSPGPGWRFEVLALELAGEMKRRDFPVDVLATAALLGVRGPM